MSPDKAALLKCIEPLTKYMEFQTGVGLIREPEKTRAIAQRKENQMRQVERQSSRSRKGNRFGTDYPHDDVHLDLR